LNEKNYIRALWGLISNACGVAKHSASSCY
jgi:hypothetical protein